MSDVTVSTKEIMIRPDDSFKVFPKGGNIGAQTYRICNVE
jgi:hypothetical protein